MVTNCSIPIAFPLTFQLCLLFNWTLSESQMFRDVMIVFLHLLFQNEMYVHCLLEICPVLHWSRLSSLTIDAKSKIVPIPFTLSLQLCMRYHLT